MQNSPGYTGSVNNNEKLCIEHKQKVTHIIFIKPLTGHSIGSYMDSYLENVGLALSLPACLSINGYKNLYQDVYPPTFVVLGMAHQSQGKH